jgi:hypothetical protein
VAKNSLGSSVGGDDHIIHTEEKTRTKHCQLYIYTTTTDEESNFPLATA